MFFNVGLSILAICMREVINRHHISFKHAFAGLHWAFSTQPNFRVHFILSLIALILGLILGISRLEMVIIIFTIILGLSAEMVNTALEAMTDLITKEWRTEAKIAKDVSAGMMLLTAFGAILVAVYIFVPYLTRMFS